MEYTNPWVSIRAEDYDRHMDHENVSQLRMLNGIIKSQLKTIPVEMRSQAKVVIPGITNGNGLEYILPLGIGSVVGIDINSSFLEVCRQRHATLGDKLALHRLDLEHELSLVHKVMRDADLVIANLLIEHIHLFQFTEIIRDLPKACRISCVIQQNPDGLPYTPSNYDHIFKDVLPTIETVDLGRLTRAMAGQGRLLALREEYVLPSKKVFIRADYQ